MDSLDLLARENEFKKLNKELEKKSESLLKEIEHVMQKPDFFNEFSHSLTLNPQTNNLKKHCCSKSPTPEQNTPTKTKNYNKTPKKTPKHVQELQNATADGVQNCAKDNSSCAKDSSDSAKDNSNCARVTCDCCTIPRNDRISEEMGFLYAFVSVSVQENVLPQSFLKDRATVEGVCKFLSSKVKLMQEQIDKLQAAINKKASQCEVHLTHQAELESERMTLLNKCNNLITASTESKGKCVMLQKRLEEKDRLYKEQRSETDKLASEIKRLRSKSGSMEARCATQEETIDNLKYQLDLAKKAEKEFRDSTRHLSTNHVAAISALEARCKSLITRSEKQAALIDNLKRQNVVLTARGALSSLEDEYSTLLTE